MPCSAEVGGSASACRSPQRVSRPRKWNYSVPPGLREFAICRTPGGGGGGRFADRGRNEISGVSDGRPPRRKVMVARVVVAPWLRHAEGTAAAGVPV